LNTSLGFKASGWKYMLFAGCLEFKMKIY